MPTDQPLTVTWIQTENQLPEDGKYVFTAERSSMDEGPEVHIAYFEYTEDENNPHFFMDLVHDEPIDALAWIPLPEFDMEQVERVTYKALRARERAEQKETNETTTDSDNSTASNSSSSG